jgi:putative oxidoreductase
MLNRLFSAESWSPTASDWASLILRLSGGGFMLLHGYPKLMQMVKGDWGFADPIYLGEPISLALTVFAEFFCAIFIIIGLWTRLALIPLIITMLVAVLIIHAADPISDKEHGLLFLMPYLALFLLGSGQFSLDALIALRKQTN